MLSDALMMTYLDQDGQRLYVYRRTEDHKLHCTLCRQTILVRNRDKHESGYLHRQAMIEAVDRAA